MSTFSHKHLKVLCDMANAQGVLHQESYYDEGEDRMIRRYSQNTDPIIRGRQAIRDLAHPVAAAIVDHDDLELVSVILERSDDASNRALDARFFVEARHDQRQADAPAGLRLRWLVRGGRHRW